MSERDYPKGHPAASDYKGETYTPPRAPWQDDFDQHHPAYAGANTSELDTPDGMRAAHNRVQQDLTELRAIGALPSEHVEDFERENIPALKEREAREYLASRGYNSPAIEDILRKYGVDAVLADRTAATQQ